MHDRSLWVVFPAGTTEVSFSTTFTFAQRLTELSVQLLPGYHLRR